MGGRGRGSAFERAAGVMYEGCWCAVCRFLMMWAAFLPIALYNKFRWTTPVIAAAVAFLLFGVENIGVQVSKPLEAISESLFCYHFVAV